MSRPRDPYDWVESWAWPILERGQLPGCADLVLLRLAAHGNAEGITRPSARGLAAQVGRSDRAVRDALEVLRSLGYIDGTPARSRVTSWRLVRDEDEQIQLRTRPAMKVKVKNFNVKTSLSPPTELQRVERERRWSSSTPSTSSGCGSSNERQRRT